MLLVLEVTLTASLALAVPMASMPALMARCFDRRRDDGDGRAAGPRTGRLAAGPVPAARPARAMLGFVDGPAGANQSESDCRLRRRLCGCLPWPAHYGPAGSAQQLRQPGRRGPFAHPEELPRLPAARSISWRPVLAAIEQRIRPGVRRAAETPARSPRVTGDAVTSSERKPGGHTAAAAIDGHPPPAAAPAAASLRGWPAGSSARPCRRAGDPAWRAHRRPRPATTAASATCPTMAPCRCCAATSASSCAFTGDSSKCEPGG